MKTKLFLVVTFATIFTLEAQIQKKKIIIGLNGGFTDNSFSSGITSTYYNKNIRDLDISFEAGYVTSDHFIIGAGFGYEWAKENALNILYFTGYVASEVTETRLNGFQPYAFLKYYTPLNEKLLFSASLNLGAGFIKKDEDWFKVTSTNRASDSLLSPIPMDYNYVNQNGAISNYHYQLVSIIPELVYFIKPKIGLMLKPGIFQCMFNEDWKPFWYLSVKPRDWNFGVLLSF